MEKSDILRRAEKLLARTTAASGGTQAEIETAAEILSRLLAKHQLSMADLTAGRSNESMEKRDGRHGRETPPVAGENLFRHHIALAYDCTTVLSGPKQWLVGHKSDVEIAEYMGDTLLRTIGEMAVIAALTARVKPKAYDAYITSYLVAAARAIHERIKAMRTHESSGEHALVVVKDQELKAFVREAFPNLHASNLSGGSNSAAAALGRSAGQNVAIRAGVSGSTGASQLALGHKK